MQPKDAIVEAAVNDMAVIYVSLQELNMSVWLRLDLTMAQFRALAVVSRYRDITVGELGGELSIGQSTASLLVDHLVCHGLVARVEDPADRRRALLSLTPAGEGLLGELRQGNRGALREWLNALSAEDLEGISRGLHSLAGSARTRAPQLKAVAKETTS